jgi:mono/diheme cytochrome c family protein
MKRNYVAISATGAILVVAFAWASWAQSGDDQPRPRVNTQMHGAAAGAPAPDPASIIIPDALSARATYGKTLFDSACSACHGTNGAGGTGSAPPLIHPIYETGHHPDTTFVRAAMGGVQAHHWDFGDMPPVEGIAEKEVALIATYIREVQRANGIE